ncbi:LytR C-terminal domain-containing protein [Candidatus Microgenomates bacterium]|nr:LytR C-terminal domain-containing protein [Candidatus Microgenomates bacterium]
MPLKSAPIKSGSARAKASGGWKAMQYRSKVKKRTKLALIALGLIVILLVLGQLVNLTRMLFSPWQAELSPRDYLWDDHFNINILVYTNPVSVFSFNPSEQKITVIKIPDQIYMEVPGGFGNWQVRSIYQLGQTTKRGGNTLLKQSLSSFLGIPIEGVLEPTDDLRQKGVEELIELMRQNPLNIFLLIPNLKTDLKLWELIRLKFALWGVRFDKVKILDLLELNVLERQRLADGSEVLTADLIRIDGILSDFEDPQIKKEHLSVAVFNATDYPQLAQKAARLITNMGGNVIMVTNAPQRLDKTKVVGENSVTLKRLVQIFGCDNCDKIELKDLGLDSSRGQINLFLGEDFYQKI